MHTLESITIKYNQIMKNNSLLSLLPAILLTSLAWVEWFSWTPGNSYLTALLPLNVPASFYLAVILLAVSITIIASSATVNSLMAAISFYVWRRSQLPVSLSDGAKSVLNFVLPCILTITAVVALYALIPAAKNAKYGDALNLAGLIYVCAVLTVLSKGFALPQIIRIRFGGGAGPIISHEPQKTVIMDLPVKGITYIKRKSEQVWNKLLDPYNSVRLNAGDSAVCLNSESFFFSSPLELKGADYVILIHLAARPNVESFPKNCYATSIISVERFVRLDDAQRMNLIRAHLSSVKNIIDKQVAAHKALLTEAIGNSILGNFLGHGMEKEILFEDKRDLDAMKLTLSQQVSNAIMGVKANSAICDIELSISGFELSGLLKQEIDLLIDGLKTRTLKEHELKMEISKIIAVHGQSAANNVFDLTSSANSSSYYKHVSGQNAGAESPTLVKAEVHARAKQHIAMQLKRMGTASTKSLYDVFVECNMVPAAMPGVTNAQLIHTLEQTLQTPIVKLSNPESDYYTS